MQFVLAKSKGRPHALPVVKLVPLKDITQTMLFRLTLYGSVENATMLFPTFAESLRIKAEKNTLIRAPVDEKL
jgi:hypothetical protein